MKFYRYTTYNELSVQPFKYQNQQIPTLCMYNGNHKINKKPKFT